jgi:hypothetical protein
MAYIEPVGIAMVAAPEKRKDPMSEYGSLREKIAAESEARKIKYAAFEVAYAKAAAAGKAAGEAAMPCPMIVQQRASPLNDNSVVVQQWRVPEGMCGFAWVTVSPGNCAFANWLKKNKFASKAYGGGVQIWINAFNQSVERKEACANAMAAVLREELGVKAFSGSRLD